MHFMKMHIFEKLQLAYMSENIGWKYVDLKNDIKPLFEAVEQVIFL
jgi:myosin heavy subunit